MGYGSSAQGRKKTKLQESMGDPDYFSTTTATSTFVEIVEGLIDQRCRG